MVDKRLVIFSLISSFMSGIFGVVNRFFEAVTLMDIRIVFYSGLLLIFVLLILGFFLVKDLISRIKAKRRSKKRLRRRS